LRVKYDRSTDAAYVYFVEGELSGRVERSVVCDVETEMGSIHLDFDGSGKLVGMEVLGASRLLPRELIVGTDVEH
jgi:uncharacterized protein YuzE